MIKQQQHPKKAFILKKESEERSASTTNNNSSSSSIKRRRVSFEQPHMPMSLAAPAKMIKKEDHAMTFCIAGDINHNDDTEVRAHLERIPKLLLEDLQGHDASVVTKGLTRLANLFMISLQFRQEAYESGAAGILLVVMKTWRFHSDIQQEACRCWQNLALQYPEAVRSFARVGALEAVLTALQQFPNILQVQKNGFAAINNCLAVHEEPNIVAPLARHFVNNLRGLELVTRTMEDCPDEAKLQKRCCGILFSLCALYPDCKASIRKLGAIALVGKAVKTHAEDHAVHVVAKFFLTAMCKTST